MGAFYTHSRISRCPVNLTLLFSVRFFYYQVSYLKAALVRWATGKRLTDRQLPTTQTNPYNRNLTLPSWN